MTESYPRLSDEQRRMLDSKRTAKWSARNMGVFFGAEAPPAGTTVPDYYYEISNEDREVFEQAIADTTSDNHERKLAARNALSVALRSTGALGALLSYGGEKLLNFLGFGVVANVGAGGGASFTGSYRDASFYNIAFPGIMRSVVTRASLSTVSGTTRRVEIDVTNYPEKWAEGRAGDPLTYRYMSKSGRVGYVQGTSGGSGGYIGFGGDGGKGISDPWGPPPAHGARFEVGTGAAQPIDEYISRWRYVSEFTCSSGTALSFYVNDIIASPDSDYLNPQEGERRYFGAEDLTCGSTYGEDFGLPPLEGTEHTGSEKSDETDVTKEELVKIIEKIKEDPDYKGHLRDACEGSGAGPGGTPIGDGGIGGGPGYGPGGPGRYGPGGPPIGGGGGRIDFPVNPPGYRDPTAPGGIGSPWQPGKRVCVDLGDGERYCGNIGRIKPPGAPRFRPPGGIGGRFPGGPRIDLEPPIPPGPHQFAKKTCFRGRPDDIIRSILDSMGADMSCVIFDSPTDVRIFPAVCFAARTDKRIALNHFLDRAGWGIFPAPDGCLIIGVDDPLNVHWYYHENVDLISSELEWDRYEAFETIEVFRPDKRNKAGRLVEKGESVPMAVPNPVAAPRGSIHKIEVPWGTKRAEMARIAREKARRLSRLALPRIAFDVPLHNGLRQRHQIHIQQPSLDFEQVFVVTEVGKEITTGDKGSALTTGVARYIVPEVTV